MAPQLLASVCLAAGVALGSLLSLGRRKLRARGADLFDMDGRLLEGKHMVGAGSWRSSPRHVAACGSGNSLAFLGSRPRFGHEYLMTVWLGLPCAVLQPHPSVNHLALNPTPPHLLVVAGV